MNATRIEITLKWCEITRETCFHPTNVELETACNATAGGLNVHVVILDFTVRLCFSPSTVEVGTTSVQAQTTLKTFIIHVWIPLPFSSHIPGFFLVGRWLHAFAPCWALDRTEPETVQPVALKRHGGLNSAYHYLLTASHIHNVKREFRNYGPAQNLALSSPGGWTPCECVVNLPAAPDPLCSDRKWCRTLLRLGAVWLRVCKLTRAGMQEGLKKPSTSTYRSHLSPPTPLSGDTPCPHTCCHQLPLVFKQ